MWSMAELYPCERDGEADAHDLPAPPVSHLPPISLFLDFDGTLVELAEQPDQVEVQPPLPELLLRLERMLDGRIALLTGRGADHVAALLGPVTYPIAGSHGAELREGGRTTAPNRPAQLDEALAELQQFSVNRPGLVIESKPLGVGLHYRQRAQDEQESRAFASELAQRLGLHLQPGKMVFELRISGSDKGTALAALMKRAPMKGSRPLFLGDDLTDEPGFEVATQLGGAGVLVGAMRLTAARYRLDSVDAVHTWLERLAKA